MPQRDPAGKQYPWAGLVIISVEIVTGIYGQLLLHLSVGLQLVLIFGVLAIVAAVTTQYHVSNSPPGPDVFLSFLQAVGRVQLAALRWLVRIAPGIAAGALVFYLTPA